MLAVNRQDIHPVLPRSPHDDLACHDEDFLAGHGDVLARLDRRQSRLQTSGSHDGYQDQIGFRQGRQLDKPLDPIRARRECGFSTRKIFCQIRKGLGVVVSREPHNLHPLGNILGDLEGAGANRARGTQYNNAPHLHPIPSTNRM